MLKKLRSSDSHSPLFICCCSGMIGYFRLRSAISGSDRKLTALIGYFRTRSVLLCYFRFCSVIFGSVHLRQSSQNFINCFFWFCHKRRLQRTGRHDRAPKQLGTRTVFPKFSLLPLGLHCHTNSFLPSAVNQLNPS